MGSTSCGAGLTLKSFSCDTTIPGPFAKWYGQSGPCQAHCRPVASTWAGFATGWKAGEARRKPVWPSATPRG
ncbi:MAG: hypothetical protein ACLUPV_05120 [Bilophila wadsworthia]